MFAWGPMAGLPVASAGAVGGTLHPALEELQRFLALRCFVDTRFGLGDRACRFISRAFAGLWALALGPRGRRKVVAEVEEDIMDFIIGRCVRFDIWFGSRGHLGLS